MEGNRSGSPKGFRQMWRRFRAACDAFFNNKSKYFEDIDSTFEDNLKAKEVLMEEMESFEPGEDRKKNLEALEEFQSRFNAIGYVPSGKKEMDKRAVQGGPGQSP